MGHSEVRTYGHDSGRGIHKDHTMKLYVAITALGVLALTTSAKLRCWNRQEGQSYMTYCETDYGIASDGQCTVSGYRAECWQQSRKNGEVFQKALCYSEVWGKGKGSGKNEVDCCKTDDDCKDSCNGVICGVSW